MKRLYPLFRALSLIVFMFGLTMLLPVGLSWYLQDGAEMSFAVSMGITLGVALGLWLLTRHDKRDLKIRDGFLIVVLVWTTLPAFATLPLMIQLGTSFTDAYFECVSGLTTTGATVLSDLDKAPPSINLWRAQLIWLGGMGLIVLAVAILPLLGIGGRQMFKAETPGPMKDSKMTPRIAQTAKGLWGVYALFTLACILAFWWAGMTFLDAVVHAFSTMGLGGFSSHDASFGYFDSPLIEAITIFFMLLAGFNFATHFKALASGSFQPYRHDPEARWFLFTIVASILGISLFLLAHGVYDSFLESLRYTAFNLVSVATTTGFGNTDFGLWPVFAPLWMLFLANFVTCAGSTGGGIKMIRTIILYKQLYRELVRAIHPNVVYPVKLGRQIVQGNILFSVLAFAFVYMSCYVAMTLLLLFSGLDPLSSLSAIAACLSNTGPGLNLVGPSTTYAVLTDFQTWVCTLSMLLGRLEIFTLLVVLTPAFWRK